MKTLTQTFITLLLIVSMYNTGTAQFMRGNIQAQIKMNQALQRPISTDIYSKKNKNETSTTSKDNISTSIASSRKSTYRLKTPEGFVGFTLLNEKENAFTGSLYALQENSIVFQSSNQGNGLLEMPVNTIDYLEVKGRSSAKQGMVKGAVIGTLTGILAGALIGSLSGDEKVNRNDDFGTAFAKSTVGSSKAKSVGYGVLFGGLGMVTGGIIGSVTAQATVKIPIDGSKSTYDLQKKRLQQYSLN